MATPPILNTLPLICAHTLGEHYRRAHHRTSDREPPSNAELYYWWARKHLNTRAYEPEIGSSATLFFDHTSSPLKVERQAGGFIIERLLGSGEGQNIGFARWSVW